MIVKLMITALLNSLLTVFIYAAEKHTLFCKLGRFKRQVILGFVFGAMTIFASTNIASVDIGQGVIINVCDASPICAGLIFGAPSGIISGLIGGIYRYISVLFGFSDNYDLTACAVSIIIAGIIAAALRKFMFDDKKPSWIYGLGAGVICEVIHMLMIFFTNMDDTEIAFSFVRIASVPMILCNGFSAGIAMLATSLPVREKCKRKTYKKQISTTFQFRLFICVLVAYFLTSTFTYVLQSRMSNTETMSVIQRNLTDVHKDITDASDENLLEKAREVKSVYLASSDKSDEFLKTLAEKYGVSDIHIVDCEGIIINSNDSKYIGFNMKSGGQSKDFLTHMGVGEEEYVQAYQPQSYDGAASRKYGAVALGDGEFLQVGYDAVKFREDISSYVGKISRNRHIGNNGFVVICDENWNIVSDGGEYSGQNLIDMGMSVDIAKPQIKEIFNMDIRGKEYIAAYSFAEGYYILGAIPKSEALFMRDVSVYISTFTEILIFAALFVLVYFLIKIIIIDNLFRVNSALSKIADGDLDVTVNVRNNEEFDSLSDDINSTVNTLKHYIIEAEKRIDEELEFAKQIQYSALPSVFPPFPDRKDFNIFAQMFTAQEVGGDFYDFYMLGESKIAFLIADVSGKGIGAAMFMMRAKTTIKDLAESGMEVNDILTAANNRLCENNDAGMFVTAWMAIVDLKSGVMKFVNAGHTPPLLRRTDGRFEYIKTRSGFVLAGMEEIKYTKNELQLMPGDMIYLYTDGVTEAADAYDNLYGGEKLISLMNGQKNSDVKELCDTVKTDIEKFANGAPQTDDITMLTFKLNFIKGEDKLIFCPHIDAEAAVTEFAAQLTEKLDVMPKISGKVNIVIDEIYSNIVKYSTAKNAMISYSIGDESLLLRFEDDGKAYNPLKEAAEPDITLSADERCIGGLGIFIVIKMAEKVEYSRENGKNILEITIALK